MYSLKDLCSKHFSTQDMIHVNALLQKLRNLEKLYSLQPNSFNPLLNIEFSQLVNSLMQLDAICRQIRKEAIEKIEK